MLVSGAFPWFVWWLVAACACAASPELRLFAAPGSYDVETTVLLNDVARKDQEVGYKIKAALDVAPAWAGAAGGAGGDQLLLQFRLHSPQLYLKGKHMLADFLPYGSVWDQHADSTFYAHWNNGLIQEAYLDPAELPDVLNYKKSLVSLFQFQALDGEHNETDISGPCHVLYETISSNVFRKIKKRCLYESSGVVVSARRAARYTLGEGEGGLRALHAEELLALGHAELGLKARAWHRLQARAPAPAPAPPAPAPAAPGLAAALRALPAALRPLPLTMDDAAELDPDEEEEQDAAAALSELGEQHERAGGGGVAGEARAVLRALPALRRAAPARLAALLAGAAPPELPALCRLLGLAGTRAAHAAAAAALQLAARDPPPQLARAYLAAFALAAAPDEAAVLDVLRLGEEGRAAPAAHAALLAAAAAAPRAGEPAARAVRDALLRGLARCQDERCRTVRVVALGNLRRGDTAEPLLEQAERGSQQPRAALAAVRALGAAPAAALGFARLDRLGELALDERAPLELRAAALDLVARRRAPLPAPLARLAYRLHERGPHELRRVLWQRLAQLAPRHAPAARLPRMLEPHMRGWDARAHAGTSSVLARDTGLGAAGWRALLDSVQLASGGLLRRGRVRLLAERVDDPLDPEDLAPAADDADELLAVEVWTRGLEAFGGGGGGGQPGAEPAEPEEAGGGLELAVGGARMPEIALFEGQAELLGHVWAGTGSAPTPVLRALLPLRAARGACPLLAGARLAAGWRAALALALDAQAQASLWYRTARAELALRAAAAGEASARLRTAWGRVDAAALAQTEPRLRIAADLDFYDDVRLCVRVDAAAHEQRREVTLQAQQGARRLRVRRRRAAVLALPGRSLALGRPNDQTCCTLRSADADAADQ